MSIDLLEFNTLALAHFIALLSPGPDFILIIGTTLQQGLRKAAWVCLGIALANGVYILLAIGGFSLLRENPMLFWSMKMLAAAYLIYLGSLLVRSTQSTLCIPDGTSVRTRGARARMLGRGFLSAIVNPKNMIFYLSLMTLIVSPSTPSSHQIIYGAWMFFAVLLWDLLIAWSIGNRWVQQALTRHTWKIERASGLLLMSVGVLVVLR